MTVVVGYLAGKSGTAPLHLAVGAARTLRTSLTVTTIVPKPWTTPSPARVDAEYAAWADQLAADSAKEAQRYLTTLAEGVTVGYHSHAHRSVSGGLVEVVEELDADVLVLGVPMYNFGISSQLKNWIDAIARARVTFRYTEQGPEGLLTGKTVYAVLTRGGVHRDQPSDTIVPYLRTLLGFLGMTDVHFIYAEGLALGPEAHAKALTEARAEIARLTTAR